MSKPNIEIELVHTSFGRIGDEMVRRIDQVCETYANLVLSNARLAIMNPPKTGRIYKRGNRVHQASAPYEAPATDLGWLATASAVAEDDIANYAVIFFARYAKALEYGFQPRNLKPRPFLKPATFKYEELFHRAVEQAIREASQ